MKGLRLGARLTLVLVLFAVLLSGTVGTLAYVSGQSVLRTATIAELTSVAVNKERQIGAWFRSRGQALEDMARSPSMVAYSQALARGEAAPQAAREAAGLLAHAEEIANGRMLLALVERTSGRIVLASRGAWVGMQLGERDYVVRAHDATYFGAPGHASPVADRRVVVSTPVSGPGGDGGVILVGWLSVTELEDIVHQRSGFHSSDDAYLVSYDGRLLTSPRHPEGARLLDQPVRGVAITRAGRGYSGLVNGIDYRGTESVMLYRALPGLYMSLVCTIEEAEVARSGSDFASSLRIIAGLALVLTVIISLTVARSITGPLRLLQQGVARFGAGDTGYRVPVTGGDELARLGREFNHMADAIVGTEQRLRTAAADLEQGVARRTRELSQHAELLELAGDAIVVCDRGGRIVFWNRGAELLYGWNGEDALGRPIDALLQSSRPEGMQAITVALLTQGTWEGELRQVRRDGTAVRCNSRQALRRDPAGTPDAILIVNVDVGERRRAEEELQRFFMLSVDLFSISSYEGIFLRVNAAWTQTLGYSAAELVGSRVLDIFHPEDREMLRERARDLLRSPGATGVESRILTKTGEVRWFLWQAVLVPGERVLFGTARDITERRLAEAAVRASEERTRLLISSAHDACVVTDSAGMLTEWNPQAEATFGWSRAEAIGAPLHELIIPHAFRERHLAGMRRFLQDGDARVLNRRIELPGLHRDGREFPMEATISPIATEQGYLFSAFLRDISERKRVEVELLQAKNTAEAATRAKSEFLANMSHEIRTPMNSVIGMTELALADESDPARRRYLGNILHSGQHLMSLLNDVLDLSKIEAGQMELENAPFALGAVIDGVMAQSHVGAGAKGLTLSASLDPDAPRWLRGDALRLSQILLNLLSNAIKFTPAGSVTLAVGKPEADGDLQVLRFDIRDTGIGIAETDLARLFQSFQQADTSITRQFGGTGLGLAISQRLARSMGGAITVSSQPGVGSSFVLTARFGAADAPAVESAPVRAGGAPGALLEGRSFLLVEDNVFNQEVAGEFLRRVGATVDIAENGQAALDALARRSYDCVLMDVQMPVMDGLEATRRIRAGGEHDLLIIAMTANAGADDRRRCLEAGMDDFITKPVSRQAFYATIGARLGLVQETDAAPLPEPCAQAALDLRVLADLVDGDEDEVRMLARRFLDTTRDTLREIAFAGARGDAAALGALGHRCKSSARAVGAAPFARLCEELEEAGKRGDLDAALACCGRLSAAFKEVVAAVDAAGL